MVEEYFHLRGGAGEAVRVSPTVLRQQTRTLFQLLWDEGYMQEAFGADCVDGGGEASERAARHFQVEALLPVRSPAWMDFDVLEDRQMLGIHEVVFEVVSAPIEDDAADFHSHNGCGWHYSTFDQKKGQAFFTEKANRYLSYFEDGYLLDRDGRVQMKMDEPSSVLLNSTLPSGTPSVVRETVERAVRLYRKGTSSWDEREAAVRDLANALEPLREQAKARLGSKDEQELFKTLNTFAIRHMNDKQRTEFERPVFLTWLFYEMLASIHACLRLAERQAK